MQFVTISDHNCIRGSLEIAHLKDVFLSNEITTYFPENECKIHVVSWNIIEEQFTEIQRLRANIYELREYLQQQGIVHACAHPLYSINGRLTIQCFEKLLLLFNAFEVTNGGRNRRGNELVREVLQNLTREQFEQIANRHKIEPMGVHPWMKGFTGGSDDHSGAFIAKSFTECPDSASVDEFLKHVLARRSNCGGLDGTPLSFAHSLYGIGYQYYRDRFMGSAQGGGNMILKVMEEIFGREQTRLSFRGKVTYYARKIRHKPDQPAEVAFKRIVFGDMLKLLNDDWTGDDFVSSREGHEEINRKTFELASQISNQLLFQFTQRFVKKLSAGSIFGSIEALSALGPMLLGIAPYLFSFRHQNRDKEFLTTVGRHFLGMRSDALLKPKKAWFTDTVAEINGVTTVVRRMSQMAENYQHDLTLISVSDAYPNVAGRLKTFKPVGQFTLPENDTVKLACPPFLEMLDYCEREQFTELIISTPGLAGLAAVIAGKMLSTRMVGIYHTDLPQYIRYYTEDEALESVTWKYLTWFYDQMDLIYVPSRYYREQLIDNGFRPEKLRFFPHGTDTDTFSPAFCDPHFWTKYGVNGGTKVTYVGRLAREKDLDVLTEVYAELARRRPECTFAVVGDGPYLEQMKRALPYPNVVFTGFLLDEELSRAFASSHIFVFPSTTDTFGNVVLEAMASGLPVIVSDKGGPKEIVEHGRTGFVTKARSVSDLLQSIELLLDNPELRSEMSAHCRTAAMARDWDKIYLDFWQGQDNGRLQEEDLVRWRRVV